MTYKQDFISAYFTDKKLISMIFYGKLIERNLLPPDLDFSKFEPHFSLTSNDNNELVVEIDDEALEINIKPEDLDFEITNDDMKEIAEIIENASNNVDFEKITENAGKKLVEGWNKQAPELLQKRKDESKNFKVELTKVWGKSLDLLDMLLSTSLDTGVTFYEEHYNQLSENDALVFYVINHLFGRACNVVSEIHLLLSHGYADGAEARWRTLHEIVVVATFIMQNGYDVAVRFIAHERIDTFKVMNGYRDYWKDEGIEIITENEFIDLEQEKQKLLKVFGKDFKNDYGWANKALGKEKVTFFDLELSTKLDYLRPRVKEANNNIHSSSRGTTARLGLPDNANLILAGSSIYGVDEVVLNTAFSLLIMFENFLTPYPTIQNKVYVSAAYRICDLIDEANTVARKELNVLEDTD